MQQAHKKASYTGWPPVGPRRMTACRKEGCLVPGWSSDPFMPLGLQQASWFDSSSPQTCNRWGLLRPTPILIPATPSWPSTQNPRSMPRHCGVDRPPYTYWDHRFSCPLESLTSHRDIIRLRKFSWENMILILHNYYSVINLFIMLFPIR